MKYELYSKSGSWGGGEIIYKQSVGQASLRTSHKEGATGRKRSRMQMIPESLSHGMRQAGPLASLFGSIYT